MPNIPFLAAAVAASVAGALAWHSSQKAVALEVLLADRTEQVSRLETEKSGLAAEVQQLRAEVSSHEKVEAERLAAEAARNAATVSADDLKTFGEPCRMWIAREFGNKDAPATTLLLTTIEDSWMKNGKLVFEVSTPSSLGSSASVFLCVVDKDKGSMFKPGAFETATWRRE